MGHYANTEMKMKNEIVYDFLHAWEAMEALTVRPKEK